MADRSKRTPEGEDDVLGQMDDKDLDLDVGSEHEETEEDESEESEEPDQESEEEEDEQPDGPTREDEETNRGQSQKYVTPKVSADKKGNLVDEKGKIIAPAGPARRFYEDKVKAERGLANAGQMITHQRTVMAQAGQAIQYMKDQLTHIQSTQDLPKQLGLNNDEYVEFLQLGAKFKTDPVNAVKYLLTRAAQRGIKLDELGAGGGIDLSVITNDITKQIDQRLAPITNRFKEGETVERQQQQERMGLLELQSQGVPEEYLKVVYAMGQQAEFRGANPSERWLRLQNYLLRQRQQSPNGKNPNRARLSGQQRPGAERRGNVIDDSPVDADVDFKDIVKAVIADHGLPPDYK